MPVAFIDGTSFAFDGAITVLEAARQLGIEIPTVCHDPRMTPLGTCRLCCVDIQGEAHPQISCRTALQDGMTVLSQTPALRAYRKQILSWMATHVSPTDFMKPGEVFATFHDPRVRLNRLTGAQRDSIVHTPEYKVTAVSIEPG